MDKHADTYGQLRDRFVAAQRNVALVKHHNVKIVELNHAVQAENDRYEQLTAELAAEQRDVEKLEKFSLKR